jgi:hypothetical protein
MWRSIGLPARTSEFWNVWERPSSCDGALFRPKSNENSSNTRRSPPTSRRQPRRRDRSRTFFIITRMTAIGRRVGWCCDAESVEAIAWFGDKRPQRPERLKAHRLRTSAIVDARPSWRRAGPFNQPSRRPRKKPLFVVFCLIFAVSPSSAEFA